MNKQITSRDVAKAAGVSQSLVSLILNNVPDKKIKPETRELVLETAKRLNYTVNINARNMKNRKAGAIGLLSSWDTSSFVFSPVIKGVQAVCSKNDMGVLICTGKEGTSGIKDYIDYFHQNRIDALAYVSYVGVGYEGVIEELTKNAIPFVCIIGARDIPGVSNTDVSFLDSGYIAVKHLVEKGFKNIAYLFNGKVEEGCYAEKERFEGCRRAATDYKVSIKMEGMFTGANDEVIMLEQAEGFLEQRRYDAVIGTSYTCFIILKAAARIGLKVPDSLGVISLDNELYAPFLYPSLTTVDEPLYEIAKIATESLLENMRGDRTCKKIEVPPLLSERESTRL